MELYTIGRFALPVVIGLVAVAAFLMVVTMVFTTIRTITLVQRLTRPANDSGPSDSGHPPVTIHIHAGQASSRPPMREK